MLKVVLLTKLTNQKKLLTFLKKADKVLPMMKDEQQLIEVIRKSFDRECTCILRERTEDNTEIKYVVELDMTTEEYVKFIKMIDGK